MELLAFPKANGVSINYTTDGSSPINANAAVYEGPIRVPENCRKVCAVAQAPMYSLTSQPIVQDIPKRGEEARTIDPTQPARWQKGSKLDDSGAVWNLITQLEQTPGVVAYDVLLTATSSSGEQAVDYTGSLTTGYGGAELKSVATKLQEIVGDELLRMEIGDWAFLPGKF